MNLIDDTVNFPYGGLAGSYVHILRYSTGLEMADLKSVAGSCSHNLQRSLGNRLSKIESFKLIAPEKACIQKRKERKEKKRSDTTHTSLGRITRNALI